MAGFGNEYESDLSDEEDAGQEVTGWLDEEDPEDDEPLVKPPPAVLPPKIDIVHKSEYIVQNLDLFYALCELEDLEFEHFSDALQEELMKTLVVEEYRPGESIIVEGDMGNDLYIIVATEKTALQAEVEVVNQNILAGTEVFLTRLHRGQFFGQKFFVTRRVNKRGATVRVPHDSLINVQVAKLALEHFDKWESFRNLLLVKTVPLIQKLPRKERSQILQHLQIREFKDGDYIIKQGEKGEDFFIIQEGSVKVVETRPSPDKGWESPQDVVLVTLREGHFFGEMSLVTDEPRVASVISIKTTICLSLSKSVFRAALSDETFHDVLSEVLSKRKEIRKQREKDQMEENSSSSAPSQISPPQRRMSLRSRTQSGLSEVTISSTLSMRKLESGTKVINKYIVERELGKGSFGEVYLCRDQETNSLFAMKQIIRPSTGWNDDSGNAIRQEIAVMKRLKHQNVVGLHEVIDDQNARKIFLIQEYMEGGSLMADAESCEPIDQNVARKYFRDILRGVCYLHSEGIIHRDIKPQNMLLSGEGVVKIADFGAAVFTGAQEKVAFGGTPAFMAPELFMTSDKDKDQDFTKSPGIDIFALGATLYFMVVGRPPWMAKNQIDLATKIKNIELVFPNEGLDPHMKHLLRQMLAKDYRLRCNLDTIVMDDWVTFEGSDPLFEKDDTLIHDFISYDNLLQIEKQEQEALEAGGNTSNSNLTANLSLNTNGQFSGKPSFHKVLLVHPSLVIRTMLHDQLNQTHPTISVCASNSDEAYHLLRSVMDTHPQRNFDFIFCELFLPTKRDGLQMVKAIRRAGFKGKIIGMTVSTEDMKEFLEGDGVDVVVRRPIANRELSRLLTVADTEHMAEGFGGEHVVGTPVEKITAEEFDNAITLNAASRTASLRSMSFSDNSTSQMDLHAVHKNSLDNDDDLVDEDVQDFDTFSSNASVDRTAQGNVPPSESPDIDLSRLNLLDKGGLMRKRAFMVVPYGTSTGDETDVFDRPLNILGLKEGGGNRRARREQAMRHSKLAHQYRQAKKEGDAQKVNSSRNLLNTIKSQSRRSMMMSVRGLEDGTRSSSPSTGFSPSTDVGLGPAGTPVGGDGGCGGRASPPCGTRGGSGSVSMNDVDLFIGNTVEECDADDQEDSEDDHLEDTDPEEESILDDSSSDDDFGIAADEIKQLDNDAFEEEFSKLIRKKSFNNDQELKEWNHTLVGVDLRGMLRQAHPTVAPREDDDKAAGPDANGASAAANYNPTLRVLYGMAESVVSRSYMEDRSYGQAMHPSRETDHRASLAMFGVFDGHNGDYVAALLKEKYVSTFMALLQELEDHASAPTAAPASTTGSLTRQHTAGLEGGLGGSHGSGGWSSHYESKMAHLFERTNAMLDREILDRDYARQQKNLHAGIQDLQSYAGSVAVVAAVLPVSHAWALVGPPTTASTSSLASTHPSTSDAYRGVHVFVSHVGDCRAVLSHDGVAVQLTEDHKANLKTEKTRIEAAGGWVHNGRVNGALGVSRSFGDIQFKNYEACQHPVDNETDSKGIWGIHQQVVSKPDFKHFLVEDSYEFMVLASDGLWDVFSCQEAVNFVRNKLLANRDVQETAQLLINKAIERGTQDNTSVIIVAFHQ